jgi:putative membrane protein
MMHGAGGLDAIWVVVVLVVWAVSIAAAVGIGVMYVRALQPKRPSRPTLLSPLDILERRYAAGEIDREDFDEARARLREHEIDR